MLVRLQPPQVRIRPPIRYPRHLPFHRPRTRTPSIGWKDPKGSFFSLFPFLLLLLLLICLSLTTKLYLLPPFLFYRCTGVERSA